MIQRTRTRRTSRGLWRGCLPALLAACGESGTTSDATAAVGAGGPLHLEELLGQARIEGAALPSELPSSLSWSFDVEQPGWKAMSGSEAAEGGEDHAPRLERVDGALRVHLGPRDAGVAAGGDATGEVEGLVYVELPDLRRADWGEVLVRLRTSEAIEEMGIAFNLQGEPDPEDGDRWQNFGDETAVVPDGEAHDYRLRAGWSPPWFGEWKDPWTELGLWFSAPKPAHFDLLSVSVVPKAAEYAGTPVGVRDVERGGLQRRSIHVHAPASLGFSVDVPADGALHFGASVQSSTPPVTFRVLVREGSAPARTLFEEAWADETAWAQRSVDLTEFAGQRVELALAVDAAAPGAVAFWAAPTLSGSRRDPARPNVILYVIDGGGADLMSLYGYNRPTTPVLERLAEQGVVFEYAHTNSGWTKSSTASFMTSLHHSVLGGYATDSDQIPARAITMAQRFHRAGYPTAALTTNPFALTLSGLQREVDAFCDGEAEHNSSSSAELHRRFWTWREQYPGQPYWVHFQTTDVHEPHEPIAPFAGLFVTPERRARFQQWWPQLRRARGEAADTVLGRYLLRLQKLGIDPKEFFDIQRGLYDETMAHNDFELGRLVERLQASGEWERTLLIVTADHGHPAGSFSRFGRGLIEPAPADFEGALADSYRTRVPLLFVWPGHLPQGRRVAERVSLIDLLPTVLELAGLPEAEVRQGRSLVPLLMGASGWESHPIVFDQFQADQASRELAGHVELIDGRWAASLEIVPPAIEADYRAGKRPLRTAGDRRTPRPHRSSTPPLLLYDLWNDRFCTRNVNAEHPELVLKYTARLEAQWQAHRSLAEIFRGEGGAAAMSADQLNALRALGYVE